MIVIRANLVDQWLFDLRYPLNIYRECEIVFARKFDVVGAQSRIRCVMMGMTVIEIMWRLSSIT